MMTPEEQAKLDQALEAMAAEIAEDEARRAPPLPVPAARAGDIVDCVRCHGRGDLPVDRNSDARATCPVCQGVGYKTVKATPKRVPQPPAPIAAPVTGAPVATQKALVQADASPDQCDVLVIASPDTQLQIIRQVGVAPGTLRVVLPGGSFVKVGE